MRMRKAKSFLALVMTLCMVLGLFSSVGAVNVRADEDVSPVWQAVDEKLDLSNLEGLGSETVEEEVPDFADDDQVRVFIVFEDDAVIDAGYSTENIAADPEAVAYSEQLAETQEEVIEKIEDEVLDGDSLDTVYSFTILTNAVSANVAYGELTEIEAVDGVSAVYVAPVYEVMADAEPETISAGDMVGSYRTWLSGYTGAGMRVAVIDTGLDTDHPSFAEDAYLYGLEETAAKNGKQIEDYDLLGVEEIAASLDMLNAKTMYPSLTAEDVYGSAKTPFRFNYVDQGLNVTHDLDSEGDHGTHVSGITTANRYVNNNGTFEPQESGVVGVAPDAQLFVMKVFGVNGGAYTDDYMAAIQDAIVLGADAINLSLGSASAGETSDSQEYINEIFDKLEGTSTIVSISAGNAYAWSEYTEYGYIFTSDVNADTVGSPGSYKNAFTVASAINAGYTGASVEFADGFLSYYDEGSSAKNRPFTSLDTNGDGTEYEYVLIEGVGEPEDYKGIDVSGKIAIVQRGSISFYQKHDNAQAAGAIACLIYNNTAGTISMSLEGSSATIPCASITLADAKTIMTLSEHNEDNNSYTGKAKVSGKITTNYNVPDAYLMSDFSSWGVPGDLMLKPEITAPGGNIYSTLDNGQYGLMSGTSMAAPSVTGLSALVLQYIEENDLASKNNIPARTLAQALLMGTASPLTQADGILYSPRKQGSGLANADAATTTSSYILVGDKEGNDGKVKVEFGDDPEKKGEYSFDFTVYNMDRRSKEYYTLDSTMLTEEVLADYFVANSAHELVPEVSFTSDSFRNIYDIDGSRFISILDVTYLLAYANGSYKAEIIDSCPEAFDFNGNGIIDTNDVYTFYKAILCPSRSDIDFSKKVLAVKDSAKVTVDIRLSEDDRAYLDESFENGMFVEGFVELSGKVDQSIPVLAFYGNWTDASMYEPYDYLKAKHGDEDQLSYIGLSRTNYMTYKFAGDSSSYYYVSNFYASDDEYIADRNAISSVNGDAVGSMTTTLIRNADKMYGTITDAETGEVYKKVNKGSVTGAYYSASQGKWQSTTASVPFNWNPVDANGAPLAEGTKLNVSVTALPSYYRDETKVPGKGVSFSVPMVIDNTAPTARPNETFDHRWINADNHTLSVVVDDNRYVAAVLTVDATKSKILSRTAVNQTVAGTSTVVTIPYQETVFYIDVFDYAGNESLYRVNMSGEPDTEIAESLTISPDMVSILQGSTVQLSAKVAPVTLLDDSVTWFSDDEEVAVVDQNGVVTALSEGEVLIGARTNALGEDGEPLEEYCYVEVYTLSIGLNATLWDEEGKVYFAGFDTASLPAYQKLSPEMPQKFWSSTVIGDKLYASTYSEDQSGASLYTVDPANGYATELVADGTIWYTDMTYANKGTGSIYSTYGPYLVRSDVNGEMLGAFDMSNYTDGYLVGVAHFFSVFSNAMGAMVDDVYVIDENGSVFEVRYYDGKGYLVTKLADTGLSTKGEFYYDSFYYDDETGRFIYSLYDGSDEVKLYALEEVILDWETEEETFYTYLLGEFPSSVWPVSGLTSFSNTLMSESKAQAYLAMRGASVSELVPESVVDVFPEITRNVKIK